jgi:ABC-type polysaccharide/polyol phosphate transport system ATPase subunit
MYPAVVAENVGVRYDLRRTRKRTLRQILAEQLGRRNSTRTGQTSAFWALRNVSFTVEEGEVLGVIGRNGSGKTTLLLVMAGILEPDAGTITSFGKTSTLLTLGAGFERDLTGRENIYLNAAFLGFPRRKIEDRIDEIIEFSELDAFIDVPIRKYSSGMRARLAFSIAAHVEPDILLLDEILGVGDASFQRRSREKVEEMMVQAKAIVIVSHSMSFIRGACTKALWLSEGRVAALGEPDEVVEHYLANVDVDSGPVRAVS